MKMKKFLKITIALGLAISFKGCLLFHSVSYEITADVNGGGSAVLTIEDIRSDAIDSKELNEDKKSLFEFMYRSDEFINQMNGEGKRIKSRELLVDESKLNGRLKFDFDDIETVEGIIYEEPFYYLTLSAEDSIISTNGEVIRSDKHKRIMWDNSIEVLKFTMYSDAVKGQNLIGMAQYFESE